MCFKLRVARMERLQLTKLGQNFQVQLCHCVFEKLEKSQKKKRVMVCWPFGYSLLSLDLMGGF